MSRRPPKIPTINVYRHTPLDVHPRISKHEVVRGGASASNRDGAACEVLDILGEAASSPELPSRLEGSGIEVRSSVAEDRILLSSANSMPRTSSERPNHQAPEAEESYELPAGAGDSNVSLGTQCPHSQGGAAAFSSKRAAAASGLVPDGILKPHPLSPMSAMPRRQLRVRFSAAETSVPVREHVDHKDREARISAAASFRKAGSGALEGAKKLSLVSPNDARDWRIPIVQETSIQQDQFAEFFGRIIIPFLLMALLAALPFAGEL